MTNTSLLNHQLASRSPLSAGLSAGRCHAHTLMHHRPSPRRPFFPRLLLLILSRLCLLTRQSLPPLRLPKIDVQMIKKTQIQQRSRWALSWSLGRTISIPGLDPTSIQLRLFSAGSRHPTADAYGSATVTAISDIIH